MKAGASRTVTVIEVTILLLALAIGLSLRKGGLQQTIIESDSMAPTLVKDDRCLLDRRGATIAGLQRGDVIVFRWKSGDADTYVKRIIGLPGERVQIARGQTWINGRVLAEPYCKEAPQNEPPLMMQVPPDCFFVMGDHRNRSEDSREHGGVLRANVVGKVTRVVWPRTHARALP